MTHPSFANESRDGVDYQRLEFLGDAVLEMCVSEALWRRFPNAQEGELTRRRARIVNARSLAEFARTRGIPEALHLGRGAEATGLRNSTNVVADVLEALIAAVYLDVGLEAARDVCGRIVDHVLAAEAAIPTDDPKTALQERVQAIAKPAPVYELEDTWGPPHERFFRVSVMVGSEVLAHGTGRSKRDAERDAAESALTELTRVETEQEEQP